MGFWAGFEKRAGAVGKAVKSLSKKVDDAPTLNYSKMNRRTPNEPANTLNYNKLEKEWWSGQKGGRKAPSKGKHESKVDAARRSEQKRRGLPGRFAREEGVGAKALS